MVIARTWVVYERPSTQRPTGDEAPAPPLSFFRGKVVSMILNAEPPRSDEVLDRGEDDDKQIERSAPNDTLLSFGG